MRQTFQLTTQSEIGDYTPPTGLPGNTDDVSGFFFGGADAFLSLAVGIAVIMILVSGVQYALSAGDDEKQATAKRTLKWSVIGLVLVLLAYGIVAVVTQIFG